jgi:uncharacterized membrane protein
VCTALPEKKAQKKVRLVLEAADVSENTHKKLCDKCLFYNVQKEIIPLSQEELAHAIGKKGSMVAAVAVTDEQMSREMLYYLGIVGTVVSLVSAWVFFMGSFVRVGQMNLYNRLLDGETPRAGMFFVKGIYWKSLGLAFMKSLFIGLWSMLFVIPGIIKSFEYAMIPYILADDAEISSKDAFKKAREMMKGNKWRLFKLNLSFIGWELLCGLTLGIGMFFLLPYIHAANAEFYVELKNKQNA